ncbi:MAG TPA: MMPL family transporter [Burkholderiales bacterium]|nr:MMPL family transporter [Burkholderiales bacterium]
MSRRVLPIAAWLAALAAAAAIAASARYTADLSAFLPDSPSPAQQLLVDQLRDGAVGRVMLLAIQGGDAAARASASRTLATHLRGDARFAFVANGAAGSAQRERELLFRNRYVLSPAVRVARFEVEGLRAAIAETLDTVASSAGGLAQSLLARDPTGEMTRLVEARLADASPPAVRDGVWASRDGERAVLLVRTAASGADTDAQESAVNAVRAAFAEANPGGTLRLRMTGGGVFAVESRALIKSEVARVAALGIVLVATLLLLAYRSLIAVLLGLLPVATGAAVGVAAVASGFGFVHGVALGLGATLIGEAVDYAIYLFVQTGAQPEDRGGQRAWMGEFWPTIRLGVLTSIAGFGALLLSGFPGLAQLGLYSICGLAAAALFTRHVLPCLLPRGFSVRDLSGLGARLSAAVSFAARGRRLVPVLALAAAVVLLAKRDSLWAHDLSALNTVSLEAQNFDGRLREDLGAGDARYLVVAEGATEQQALLAAERVGATLRPLVARGVITGFDSPAHYLPSEATQRARAESLPAARVLRQRLEQALRGMSLRASRLGGFVEDVERARSGPPLTRADLQGSGLGVALDAMLLRHGSGWQSLLPLRAPLEGKGSVDAAEVRNALQGSGAVFLDLKAETDALYSGYLNEAIALSAAGVGVVLLLLMAVLRSPARVGRVVAPLGAAVLVTAAVLGAAGPPLTLLHLIGFLLVVAVGSNYALFFERAADAGAPTPRVLASLALANATTVAAFGVLATADVPVLRAIGTTVSLGALLSLVFAALLARARPGTAR